MKESKINNVAEKGLLLYHEVLLLAFNDKTGKPESDLYSLAVSAAVLAELLLAGRIKIEPNDDSFVHLIDSSPTGHDILDRSLRAIGFSKKPKSMLHWMVNRFDPNDLARLVANELCSMGILAREDSTLMWLFPVDCYPEADPQAETSIKSRLNSFLFEDETDVSERTVLLACLANIAKLLEPNFGVLKVAKKQECINEMLASNVHGKTIENIIAAFRHQQAQLEQLALLNVVFVASI